MAPEVHIAAVIFEWRSDDWWEDYKATLPPKAGGQVGRRAGDVGIPGQVERPFHLAFEGMRRKTLGAEPLQMAHTAWHYSGGMETTCPTPRGMAKPHMPDLLPAGPAEARRDRRSTSDAWSDVGQTRC